MTSEGGPPPPKLLVGTFGEAPGVLHTGLGFLPCTVLRAGSQGTLEEMLVAQRPSALLLDAAEFYLEGRPLVQRLRACLPEIRILFLDVEDTWAMWLECESDDDNDFCVTPCRTWEASTMVLAMLRESRPRLPAAVPGSESKDSAAA